MDNDLTTQPAVSQADKINQLFDWTVSGNFEHEMAKAAAVLWPGEKMRPLVAAVMKRLRESAHPDRDSVRGFVFEALHKNYQVAVAAGDTASALKSLKMMMDFVDRNSP